jgi:subtilisin family serine protease
MEPSPPQAAEESQPTGDGTIDIGSQIIVRYDSDTTRDERQTILKQENLDLIESLPLEDTQLVSSDQPVKQVIRELEENPAVKYAEPDSPRSIEQADPGFNQQWGLDNQGQAISGTLGTIDADIDALEAWNIEAGDSATTVAVLDTGIDPLHEDLIQNLYSNQAEQGTKASNGIDDDNNGYIDDYRGWDFISQDNLPVDQHGHGTHVSGIVGATGNNGVGISGVSQDVSLMPIQVLSSSGTGSVSGLINGYDYAAQNGADIVNASLAGTQFSQAEKDTIAEHPDVLFIVAAGNDGANVNNNPKYPCNHNLDNLICVTATTNQDQLANFSNYSATRVHLAQRSYLLSSMAVMRFCPEPVWLPLLLQERPLYSKVRI